MDAVSSHWPSQGMLLVSMFIPSLFLPCPLVLSPALEVINSSMLGKLEKSLGETHTGCERLLNWNVWESISWWQTWYRRAGSSSL